MSPHPYLSRLFADNEPRLAPQEKKMNKTQHTARALLNIMTKHFIGIALLVLSLAASTQAQDVNGVAGSTPSGLAPGAAAGSYALSDFDSVNVYNGNVNFHLPLLGIGGRGGAQMTMMLSLDNPKWGVSHTMNAPDGDIDYSTPQRIKGGENPGLGPGRFVVEKVGVGKNSPNEGIYASTLTRIKFIAPDGTEYELRDTVSDGQSKTYDTNVQPFRRGSVFVSADGTAATFLSTNTSGTSPVDIYDDNTRMSEPVTPVYGYLLLRDGTRFWIASTESGARTPLIRWMRDRNGNMMTFEYNPTPDLSGQYGIMRITDSLNRVVNISSAPMVTVGNTHYSPETTITYAGFNGATRTIRIQLTLLSGALRSDYPGVWTYGQLFPALKPYWDKRNVYDSLRNPDESYNLPVIKAVVLPDGRSYQLRYNRYGELARVELPTKGAVEYDYTSGSGVVGADVAIEKEIYRRVKQRKVKARRLLTDVERVEQVVTYGDPVVTGYDVVDPLNSTPVTEVEVANAETVEKHFFYGDPVYYRSGQDAFSYGKWNEGREYKTEVYKTEGETLTLLRRTENVWRNRQEVSWWPTSKPRDWEPANDPLLVETRTTLADDGATNHLMTKRTFQYDAYCNQTDVWEYAYDEGEPGPLLRHTHTDYLETNQYQGHINYRTLLLNNGSPDPEQTIHIRNLPIKQQVFGVVGGSEVEEARIIYEYDKHNIDGAHAPLVSYTEITGHDAAFGATKDTRGNLTATSRWLKDENRYITSYNQYDIAGNVVRAFDPLGAKASPKYWTDLSYADNFGAPEGTVQNGENRNTYAFVTAVTNQMGQTTYTQYDYNLGKAVDTQDINGVVTSMHYGGALDRPTQVISDTGNLAAKRQTTFTYIDGSHLIRTNSDLNTYGDNKLKSEVVYDGLGRTVETRSYETTTNYIRVDQKYDTLGRASQTSNPYRPYLNEVAMWTTTSYDELGRVISVKTPDNTSVTTVYSGSTVTVKDQAGKDRQSRTDALGRLVEVIEDPDTNGIAGLKYSTTYTYDALDNLLKVKQGSQAERLFVYDSLSQLKSTDNPESGLIQYEYDDNGNLKKKWDERKNTAQEAVTISYTYDKLNRVKTRSYNDGTLPVAYTYDDAALPSGAPTATEFTRGSATGRLVAITYGATGEGTYYGYDALGRVVRSLQKTGTQKYSMPEYKYDLAGNLVSQSYPSGRIVKTAYDGAGRVKEVTGQKAIDTWAKVYASGFGYAAHGAVSKMMLGNRLWEHATFNKRLQAIEIGLGVSAQDSSLLKLICGYGATQNNGNMMSQTITVAQTSTAPALTLTQTYTYDELNRLKVAQEKKGTVAQWKQTFQYDQYGNRTLNTANGNTTSGLVGSNPSISAVNNRISKAGYQYDAAGNMTKDEEDHTYQYDAENRLKNFDGGVGATYIYDGEGHRVKKVTNNGMQTTTFVYDATGKLIAEYAPYTAGSKTETSYLTQDTLGSTRVVTGWDPATKKALMKARYDYLPFGEEIASSYSGRSAIAGYGSSDNARQKFTGKERDNETGLDYFGARYYASAQGRFSSADPKPVTKENFLNPQRWNLYIYVNNNPLTAIDPEGEDGQGKGGDKVISVFMDLTLKDLGRVVTKNSVTGKVMSDVPNTIPWQETKAGAPPGYRVELYGPSDVTGEKGPPQAVTDVAFENALKNSDVVIYIGHGRGDTSTVPFKQQGIEVGMTFYGTKGTEPATGLGIVQPDSVSAGPKPEAMASVVVNFSCDASRNVGSYFNFVGKNQTVVTMYSNWDGVTSADAVSKAAHAFVKTYMATNGNTQKAVDAANEVLSKTPGEQKQNVGDEVRKDKVN
jgi:RHS repeat-associated protein